MVPEWLYQLLFGLFLGRTSLTVSVVENVFDEIGWKSLQSKSFFLWTNQEIGSLKWQSFECGSWTCRSNLELTSLLAENFIKNKTSENLRDRMKNLPFGSHLNLLCNFEVCPGFCHISLCGDYHFQHCRGFECYLSSLIVPESLEEIEVGEEGVREVVVVCFRLRGETSDEKELVDVVGRMQAGIFSGGEYEGFTSEDALRRANLTETSDLATLIHSSGMPTCNYRFVRFFSCFNVNTLWPLCVPCDSFHVRIWCRISSWKISFCYSVQSFRGTCFASECSEAGNCCCVRV